MTWINTCPIDKTQKEFLGISRKITGGIDPESGQPIIERFRWQECAKGHFSREDMDTGLTVSIQTEVPDKKLFKVSHDD